MWKLLAAVPAAALIGGCAAAQHDDGEAQLTAEVAEVLRRIAAGQPPRERFSDKAAATALASGTAERQLRSCPAPAPQLLARQALGGGSRYFYRVACGLDALQLELDYDSAGRIARLALRPSR